MQTKRQLNQKKATSTVLRTSLVVTSLVGSLLVTAPVTAASACKGLENSACSANASCGWVKGYQRKDGRNVKSFCRTKSIAKKAPSKKSLAKNTASTAVAAAPSSE